MNIETIQEFKKVKVRSGNMLDNLMFSIDQKHVIINEKIIIDFLIEYNDLNNKLFDKLKNEAGTKSATTKIKMAKKFI